MNSPQKLNALASTTDRPRALAQHRPPLGGRVPCDSHRGTRRTFGYVWGQGWRPPAIAGRPLWALPWSTTQGCDSLGPSEMGLDRNPRKRLRSSHGTREPSLAQSPGPRQAPTVTWQRFPRSTVMSATWSPVGIDTCWLNSHTVTQLSVGPKSLTVVESGSTRNA